MKISRHAISRRPLTQRQQLRLLSTSLLQARYALREEQLARSCENAAAFEAGIEKPWRGTATRIRRLRRDARAFRRQARAFVYDLPLQFQPRRPLLGSDGQPLWQGPRLLTRHDLRADPDLRAAYLIWIERCAPRWLEDGRATPLAIRRAVRWANR